MPLREDEEFVIRAVADQFASTWRPAERDPPDAYLSLSPRDETIAVEISTLTQNVIDERGTRPRLSDDQVMISIIDDLNIKFADRIPDDYSISMFFRTPIYQVNKTRKALETYVKTLIEDITILPCDGATIDVYGNPIKITRRREMPNKSISARAHRRIWASAGHRLSTPNILQNATQILEERLSNKAGKCARLIVELPVWLALFNDYWLADAKTYQQALASSSLSHPFERILLVGGDRSVETIFCLSDF